MEVYGKIFVVVTVLGIIFAGLAAYLFYLDSKLNKLEKRISEIEKEDF